MSQCTYLYLHVSAAPRISKYLSCSFVDELALLAAKAYAGDSRRELRMMILETNVIMVNNTKYQQIKSRKTPRVSISPSPFSTINGNPFSIY